MDDLSFDLADATAKTENDELNGNMIKPKKKQKRKSSGSASSSSPLWLRKKDSWQSQALLKTCLEPEELKLWQLNL